MRGLHRGNHASSGINRTNHRPRHQLHRHREPLRLRHFRRIHWTGVAQSQHRAGSSCSRQQEVYFNDGHLSKEAINYEIDGTLKRLDTDYLEEPYTAHELVGPLSRPEEKDLSGALAPTLKETTRN